MRMHIHIFFISTQTYNDMVKPIDIIYVCKLIHIPLFMNRHLTYRVYSIFLNKGPLKFLLEGGCINGGTLLKFSTQ